MTFDRIQRRYGWTDEQVLQLPYARFAQVARLVAECEARDRAWQVYVAHPPMEGDRVLTWDEYLRHVGLSHLSRRGRLTADERARIVARAHQLAERARHGLLAGQYRRVEPEDLVGQNA